MAICYECGKTLVTSEQAEIEPVYFRDDGECICAECDPRSMEYVTIGNSDLPASTVAKFSISAGEIAVDIHAGKLRIRAMVGAINVRPNGSNEIFVSIGEYL